MVKPKPAYLTESTWLDRISPLKLDVLCIAVLLAIVFALFRDIIFNDMVFSTAGDTAAAHSWEKAIKHLEQVEKVSPLWIPYIFSGMPIAGSLLFPDDVNYLENILQFLSRFVFLGSELHWFVLHYFLMGLSMYLLSRSLGFTPIPSLLAALTLMLHPYAIGLARGGHGSKLISLSYIPLLLVFMNNLFQRRDLLSLGLLSATVGTLLLSRHPQIAFYGLLLVGAYLIYHVLFVQQEIGRAATKLALVIVALGIGFLIYIYEFLPTQEYAQFSIRGGGEAGAAGGLSYDYATNWSFHPFETLNYFIPSFFGFESPFYWGWMPFTDTTVYLGIVPIVFGILALIYARNSLTIFLTIFSGLVLLISFGKHLPLVYDLMFHYVPYFNKFRAPSMILHLMPITVGLLAAAGFSALTDLGMRLEETYLTVMRKPFALVLKILGVLLVIGFLGNEILYDVTSGFMFEKEGDLQQLQQQYGQQAHQVMAQLKRMRFDLLWKDFVKFAIISGAALGLILLYLKRSIKKGMFAFGMLAILVIDLLIISTKFIDPKPKTDFERVFAPDATVRFLKSDASLFRILPLGGLFQDNSWMYHTIQSLGGYSPAKLKIYQEMLDSCLYRSQDPSSPYFNRNIVSMLNAKYVIVPGQLPNTDMRVVNVDQAKQLVTYENPHVLPRAWFVDEVVIAANKREVFANLNSPAFNPRIRAVLESPPSTRPVKSDSTAVQLTAFQTHTITLSAFCTHPSLLVLSEVYYPAGWKAFIDGVETEIYKTNYVLRSVVVPPGRHAVEFRFEPAVYRQGLLVTNLAWGVTALLIIVGLVRQPAIRALLLKQ